MGWPQIVILILAAMGLGIAMVKHGESQGEYNVFVSLFAGGLHLWILYMGGFFS